MKILARLSISSSEVDPVLLAKLRSEFPEQEALRGFSLVKHIDDNCMQEALDLLGAAGLRPWDFNQERPLEVGVEYYLTYERVYDATDLSACEYLQILPPPKAFHMEAYWRTESGRIILPKYKMPRGFDIMITNLRIAYFATERAKTTIEEARLRNISFLPACFGPARLQKGDTEDSIAAQYGRFYWEIDSDFTMPPLSPSMRFKTADGSPWRRGDYSNGLHACEGLFRRPELHYRRSDLDRLEPFDLARTLEPFGNYRSYDKQLCPLIASGRFYETCVAGKLKTGWIPVRVDPD